MSLFRKRGRVGEWDYMLGSGLFAQQKYYEAEKAFRQAVQEQTQALGREHPYTIYSKSWLGSALYQQQKYQEAEKTFQQAVQEQEKVLGREHVDTLINGYWLGRALYKQQKFQEAEKIFWQVYHSQEWVLGNEHADTLNSKSWLGSALYKQQKYQEAEKVLQQAVHGLEVLDKEDVNTIDSKYWLGKALYKQQKYQEAEEALRQAVQGYNKVAGKENKYTHYSNYWLGSALYKQQKYQEAEEALRQAAQGYDEVLGKEHEYTLNSRRVLQEVLVALSTPIPVNKPTATLTTNLSTFIPTGSQTGDATAAKHEDGWEGDSDSIYVSSVQSLPLLVSDLSSASMRDKYGLKAAERLAALLSEDSALNSMYEAAIVNLSPKRFYQDHNQLLKVFFKDLRSETQSSVQLATVRGLRSRDRRHEITSLIHRVFEPLDSHKQQEIKVPRGQEPNQKQLLDDYSRERTPALQIDSLTRLVTDLEQSNFTTPEEEDESVEEETDSDYSDGNDNQLLGQVDTETCEYLEPLETFITKGNAFARFKTNVRYHLQSPTDLSEVLKSRDIHIVQRFLARNFASAATSSYGWLHELDEAGYSSREIAELLLEDICDSPWIYYTPQPRTRHRIQTIFHVPDCAHQASSNTKPQSLLYSEQVYSRSLPLHTNVRRQVEELCGIGGVVPSSRDVSTWNGSVTFEDESSGSVITYASTSGTVQQSRNDLAFKISNVLGNFCAAAAAVQSSGLCCDSFTVLLRMQDCLQLRRIELRHAIQMEIYIHLALQEDNSAIGLCLQSAESILQELRVTIPKTTPNADLHYCALAAQFLCAAFLSYIQAHVGSVDPFFLDTPQRKMVLLGSQRVPGDFAINAELVELTCLAKMTRQPVLAFSSVSTSREFCLENETFRYDVQTNAEDFLDTWGPGYFVHNKANPSKIHAIAIGDGFVSLVDSKTSRFHWAKGKLAESTLQAAFEPHTIMRVGAAVSINENCCIDEAACRYSSFCALEPLGTHEVSWEAQGRQAGLQGGQYLAGTYSQTWKKSPGTTLKECKLEQADWRLIPFLEQNWGLQVSFCTSVARRVSLRELVTDLLPMFINPLEQDAWRELVDSYNIIHAFTQGNLFTWLNTLPHFLQEYVLGLVRTILEQLQHTGLDRQNTTLIIAWPQVGDIERGLKIPCRAQTCWAQVIADAEDCATFAYVTPKCLETNQLKCRGSLRAWQNASKMLVTEMSPSRPEGQLAPINATVTTTPGSETSTTATATTRWELEDRKTYYIKKLDSLLKVKVERPSSASSDVAHLVVTSSVIPRLLWKRLLLKEEERRNHRIRERQAMGDHAECVVIRARLIGV